MSNNDNENGNNNGGATAIEINYDIHSTRRFTAWVAMTGFAVICLVAEASSNVGDRNAGGKWIVAVSVLTLIVGTVGVLGNLLVRGIFDGQLPEMVLVGVLVVLWGTGLPVVMNPEHELAVKPGPEVHNATLYVFSWMSFATLLYMVGTLLQDALGLLDLREVSPQTARWYGLTAASMVVAGSATRILKTNPACNGSSSSTSSSSDQVYQDGDMADVMDDWTHQYCKRTKLAISVGILTFVAASVMTFALALRFPLPAITEKVATTGLLIMWCFGVGYITFGDETNSPGATISNLYFSSWISFILTVFLFGHAVTGASNVNANKEGNNTEGGGGGGEQQLPTTHTSQQPELPQEEDF